MLRCPSPLSDDHPHAREHGQRADTAQETTDEQREYAYQQASGELTNNNTTMDILFIHGNYPAQFRHLAEALGKSGQHRVIFLTARQDANKQPINGVTIRELKLHRLPHNATHHYLTATEESILKGQAVLREINNMIEEGVYPRLVITHGGMGLGLFIKDILPNSIHIGLFEWYFKKETSRWLIENFGLDQQLQTNLRNLPILEELTRCDIGVVPTKWQFQQFPREFNCKLRVIFDGIDTNYFKPDKDIDKGDVTIIGEDLVEPLIIKPDQVVLSYATRGMETLRGFPEFLHAAANAVQINRNLQVIIAGRDRRAYSYDAPGMNGSWKDYILDKLGNFEGKERLHFTGLLPYEYYKKLLQRSNLHCYFTRPYVTSWSLFEAAACGARLCVNKSPATEGIVKEDTKVKWVDLNKPKQLKETILNQLHDLSTQKSELRNEYALSESLKQWQDLINELLQTRK